LRLREQFYRRAIVAHRAGKKKADVMRSMLLWLIGIPVPIILLLALCTHHL